MASELHEGILEEALAGMRFWRKDWELHPSLFAVCFSIPLKPQISTVCESVGIQSALSISWLRAYERMGRFMLLFCASW